MHPQIITVSHSSQSIDQKYSDWKFEHESFVKFAGEEILLDIKNPPEVVKGWKISTTSNPKVLYVY